MEGGKCETEVGKEQLAVCECVCLTDDQFQTMVILFPLLFITHDIVTSYFSKWDMHQTNIFQDDTIKFK